MSYLTNSVALVRERTIPTTVTNLHTLQIKETRGLSPRANYADRETTAAKLVPTFADRGMSRGQRGGFPMAAI
jgi:hypothetical protein